MAPKKASENKMKEKVSPQRFAILKYKCDQYSCTFKKNITLKKHKNTRHGKSLNELGEGQFGFVFDVIPCQEEEAKLLRKEWNKEQQHEPSSSIEEDTSLSDINVEDVGVSSEDDDSFFQNMMMMETLLGEAYSGPKGLYSFLLH